MAISAAFYGLLGTHHGLPLPLHRLPRTCHGLPRAWRGFSRSTTACRGTSWRLMTLAMIISAAITAKISTTSHGHAAHGIPRQATAQRQDPQQPPRPSPWRPRAPSTKTPATPPYGNAHANASGNMGKVHVNPHGKPQCTDRSMSLPHCNPPSPLCRR